MKKYNLAIALTFSFLAQEASALSGEQLIMFKTIREHLIYKRDQLIYYLCVLPPNVAFGVVEDEMKQYIRKPVKDCMKDLVTSCSKGKMVESVCDTLEKAAKYDQAYGFYDEKVKESEVVQRECRLSEEQIRDAKERGIVWSLSCAAPAPLPEKHEIVLDLNKPIPLKKIDMEKVRFRFELPNFDRSPALAKDEYEKSNQFINTFEKPADMPVRRFDACGWNNKCISNVKVEGFR